jgi:hypothetical protein
MPAFEDNAFTGQTLFGTFYPTGYLVATLHDRTDAEHAKWRLEEAGFAEVRVWTGPEVIERHEAFLAHRSVLQRLGGLLHSDERDALEDYLAAARQDHLFLTIHIPDHHQVERAHALLVEHDVHLMHYYTAVGMADLPAHITRLPATKRAGGETRAPDTQADSRQ